jgi:hypothetical protein
VSPTGIWDTIADEARSESPLWGAALRAPEARDETPVFSRLGADEFALGLETIYEGYLLHYGRPRLFEPEDRDTAVLLGDYLYAHGLVRISALGDVSTVGHLSELISLCAQARAEGSRTPLADGAAWAATAAALGTDGGDLAAARAALRDEGDHEPLEGLARSRAGGDAVDDALRLHSERVL